VPKFIIPLVIFILSAYAERSGQYSATSSENASQFDIVSIDFDLDRIKESGTIRIILENTSTGCFLYNVHPTGFHYELAKDYWKNYADNPEELTKFVLAPFNIGHGYIMDAFRLTEKYFEDPSKWYDNVGFFLHLNSLAKYYKDPLVTAGGMNQ
jgi:membrane-bound lytic murein transglycosylase MltF